jgi:hypothetical protein
MFLLIRMVLVDDVGAGHGGKEFPEESVDRMSPWGWSSNGIADRHVNRIPASGARRVSHSRPKKTPLTFTHANTRAHSRVCHTSKDTLKRLLDVPVAPVRSLLSIMHGSPATPARVFARTYVIFADRLESVTRPCSLHASGREAAAPAVASLHDGAQHIHIP